MRRARLGLAFTGLLVTLVVIVLWLMQQREQAAHTAAGTPERSVSTPSPADFARSTPLTPTNSLPAAVEPLAEPLSATSASSGRLIVRVTRGRDHQPAADAGLLVMDTTRLYWYADVIQGRTGADGSWTLDPAPPGLLRVIEDRGDSQEARIAAGRTTELSLEVIEGRSVSGVVVDQRDEPVAGAELWLFDNQSSPHGRMVGRADVGGHFVLEDLRWQFLGARSAGHAPSDLVDVERVPASGDAGRLHLRGPGGRVAGRVTDAAGQPLPGAMVVVGPNAGFPGEPPQRDGPPSFLVRAAADGSYEVDDVPVGHVPLAAALEGRSPWASSIELAENQAVVVDIVLQPAATIGGIVRDEKGKAVVGANVWAGSSDTVFDRVQCSSDEAGRYELRCLPLGQQRVRASQDPAGQAWRELVVVAGEHYAWDPQLGAGRSFLGRVVDERGAPMPELVVFAQHVPRDDQTRMARTDSGGRFTIDGCDDAEFELEVTAKDNDSEVLVKLEGAHTGPDELVLVVPDSQRHESSVSGILVDDVGQPLSAPEVSVSAPDANDPASSLIHERASAPIDRRTGAFTIKGLQLGDYLGVVASPDWYLATFPITGLQLGEHREVGTLVFPLPGRLRAELAMPEGVGPDEVEVHVEHLGRIGVFSRPDMPAEDGQPLVRRSGPLDPREDCVLCASGPSIVPRRLTLRPASGRDTIVPLALERGVRVELSFVLGAAKGHFFKVTVLDAGGATLVNAYPEVASTSETTPAAASLSLGLAPGRYVLQLRHNRQELRIDDLEVPKDALALPPRVIQVP